jgi:alkanesulfonate monooxygenase SsuD/methylene tetrahydromethanopterin reductase-like flavin-dependent oxidoreductase (luciferase family)
VASLDTLSGGRFLFGIGAGWNREEMENHGTDPATRWGLLRDRVLAMKQIWANDEAEYHGRFVNFDPIWSWPKPVQRPHPPIIVGGSGPRVLHQVVEYGDEWWPLEGGARAPLDRIAELQRLASEAGRAPIPVTVYGVPPNRAVIERLEAGSVSRCLFRLPPAGADEVLPHLAQCAEVAAAFV